MTIAQFTVGQQVRAVETFRTFTGQGNAPVVHEGDVFEVLDVMGGVEDGDVAIMVRVPYALPTTVGEQVVAPRQVVDGRYFEPADEPAPARVGGVGMTAAASFTVGQKVRATATFQTFDSPGAPTVREGDVYEVLETWPLIPGSAEAIMIRVPQASGGAPEQYVFPEGRFVAADTPAPAEPEWDGIVYSGASEDAAPAAE